MEPQRSLDLMQMNTGLDLGRGNALERLQALHEVLLCVVLAPGLAVAIEGLNESGYTLGPCVSRPDHIARKCRSKAISSGGKWYWLYVQYIVRTCRVCP